MEKESQMKLIIQKKIKSFQVQFRSHHLILKLSLKYVRTNIVTFIMREEEGWGDSIFRESVANIHFRVNICRMWSCIWIS